MTGAAKFPLERVGWSLKRQILLLAFLALGTVGAAFFLGTQVLRQTEAARVGDAAQQLERATRHLAQVYGEVRNSPGGLMPSDPLEPGNDKLLSALTTRALSGLSGVEGGFYVNDGRRLIGYAYPTYQGSGPKTDIPLAERPAIERVAAGALARQSPVAEEVAAGSDVLLFAARPLADGGKPVGAIWLMHRLNGVHSPGYRLYSSGLLVLLMVAAASAAAGFLFTRRLDRGVSRIESALRHGATRRYSCGAHRDR